MHEIGSATITVTPRLDVYGLTPEQAIAATLGRGTCLPYWWTHDGTLHVELPKLPESISVRLPDQRDREVGSARTWQFTRDSGTCHNASKVMDEHGQARFVCSECGAWIDSRMLWNPEYRNGESPWVSGCKLNFCPNCGRKVVEPTTNDVDAEVDA